jgi:hypothetical protein
MTSVRYLRKRPTPRSNKYENQEVNEAYYLLRHGLDFMPIESAELVRNSTSESRVRKSKMTRLS